MWLLRQGASCYPTNGWLGEMFCRQSSCNCHELALRYDYRTTPPQCSGALASGCLKVVVGKLWVFVTLALPDACEQGADASSRILHTRGNTRLVVATFLLTVKSAYCTLTQRADLITAAIQQRPKFREVFFEFPIERLPA